MQPNHFLFKIKTRRLQKINIRITQIKKKKEICDNFFHNSNNIETKIKIKIKTIKIKIYNYSN